MSNRVSNSRGLNPHSPPFDSKQPEESPVAQCLLPDALLDLVVERVVRILYRKNPELKRKHPNLRTRTVIEKIYQIDPRAFQQGLELSAKLAEQFAKAEVLLAQLRSERERILRLTHPEQF